MQLWLWEHSLGVISLVPSHDCNLQQYPAPSLWQTLPMHLSEAWVISLKTGLCQLILLLWLRPTANNLF